MSDTQYEDYLKYLTYPTDIQDVKKPNKKEFGEYNTHPTIKPVKLMEWLVKLLSSEGDVVLDPFSGSGTTAVACKALNRNYIGIEMNEHYIDISKQRLSEVVTGETLKKVE